MQTQRKMAGKPFGWREGAGGDRRRTGRPAAGRAVTGQVRAGTGGNGDGDGGKGKISRWNQPGSEVPSRLVAC